MRPDQVVARALASALLAGDWQPEAMLDRAAAVLGGRRRWLPRLIRDARAAYRGPPADRPRELAAWISAHPGFTRAAVTARGRGRPLRARAWLPTPTRMGPTRWPVSPLPDLAALAESAGLDVDRLAWFADTSGRQRRTRAGPLHHYRYRWVERGAGAVPRLLEMPLPRIRTLQRTLLEQVVGPIPSHHSAHGFVPGRGVTTAVRPHAGAPVLICLDLAAFFASVTAGRVYGVLRSAGYPEPVAHALTGLCTIATPVAVIGRMPPGGPADQRFALRRHLAQGHLPAGAPTSPALANLAAHRLDARLAGYAGATGARYTRYADDLIFSGSSELARAAPGLIRAVTGIAAECGFRINPAKTRVRGRGQRRQVLGLVLNQRPTVPREEYDQLRAVLHNAIRTGGPAQNRDGLPDFRAHLTGRVAWVAAVDPERGARLRAELDRITW
jgi:hypothetical protein